MEIRNGVKYGFYLDGKEKIEDASTDPLNLIGRVFHREKVADIPKIRVGRVATCMVADFMDAERVATLYEEGVLTIEVLVADIDSQFGDEVEGGCVGFVGNKRELRTATDEFYALVRRMHRAETRLETVAKIIEWAERYVTLDPQERCTGVYPHPVERVGGKWYVGRSEGERVERPADIEIVYVYEDGGARTWKWRAGETTGVELGLRAAKRAAEECSVAHAAASDPQGV